MTVDMTFNQVKQGEYKIKSESKLLKNSNGHLHMRRNKIISNFFKRNIIRSHDVCDYKVVVVKVLLKIIFDFD